MNALFTPEQETRIAEIMRDILAGMSRQRAREESGEIELRLDWACHWAGIKPPKGEFDV